MQDQEELHLMMKHRTKELTQYSTERLLIAHMEVYRDLVDLSILDQHNIIQIQKRHPEFH